MGTVLVIIIETDPSPVEGLYWMFPSSSRIGGPVGGTGTWACKVPVSTIRALMKTKNRIMNLLEETDDPTAGSFKPDNHQASYNSPSYSPSVDRPTV
jgi:hypothetical protein